MAIDAALRRFVRTRAENRCEYCGMHQDALPFAAFHVEHVVSRQHGGGDEPENLCLSCNRCNLNKGPNLATLVKSKLVRLFNPRLQSWSDHFVQEGDRISGLTAIGQGTARLLDMNDEERRKLRRIQPNLPDS